MAKRTLEINDRFARIIAGMTRKEALKLLGRCDLCGLDIPDDAPRIVSGDKVICVPCHKRASNSKIISRKPER